MDNIIRKTASNGEPVILEYLHRLGKINGFPASATFEITPRCNFNCKMCYIHSADSNRSVTGELTAEQWLDLARQGRDMGVVAALITGGEPLVRQDFPFIYSEMKNLGLLVSVNTNGSLISGDYARFFIDNPPARLNISLYGASDNTYSALCGLPAFNTLYKNLNDLVKAGIQIKLNISLTPYNCGDMERMLEIAKELNVHAKLTTYMYPPVRRGESFCGENPARFTPDEAAFYRAKYDLIRLGENEFLRRVDKLEDFISPDECCDPEQPGEKMRCRAGTSSCWINYKGEMTACGMFGGTGFNAVELGFEKAWRLVRESTEKISTPAKCINCSYRNLCPMCAAVCASETGCFDKAPEYACAFSRSSEKYLREFAERIKNGN